MGVDREARAAAARDDIVASMQEIGPPSASVSLAEAFDFDPVDALLRTTEGSRAVFEDPPGPKSELAAARRLVEAYEVARSLAILAPKAKDGALLKKKPAGAAAPAGPPKVAGDGEPEPALEPWLPTRPRRVEDIPIFAPDRVALWKDIIANADNRGVANRLGTQPAAKALPSPRRNAPQLVVVGKQKLPAIEIPFLRYFGNYGKLITLVKTKEMSLRTEAGRIAVLAYILQVVAGGDRNRVQDNIGIGKNDEATAEQIARVMLDSNVLGPSGEISRVFFQAESNEVNLIDHLKPGQTTQLIIDIHAIDAINLFTGVRPEFTAPPAARKTGCASIEWLKELMAEVPLEYKALWVARKIEDDRGIYARDLVPGKTLPMSLFMPAGDTPTERQVVFLGGAGDQSGDHLILTEEGRIFAVNQRQRNLQAYCTAVLSVAPWVAMFYLVASVAGIVVAGEIIPALAGELLAGGARLATAPGMLTGAVRLTEAPRLVQWIDTLVQAKRWETIVNAGIAATTIAVDVHSAGGIQSYVKSLKNPWEATFLLLNLLGIKGAFKAEEFGKMIEESRTLGKAAQQLVQEEKASASAAVTVEHDVAASRGFGEAPAVRPAKTEAAAERATVPPPDRGVAGTQVDNRLGQSTPTTTKPDLLVKDELAERRLKKAQSKDPESQTPPTDEPPPGPPAPEAVPAEAPGASSAAEGQFPNDELAEMRRKKAARAQQSSEAELGAEAEAVQPQKKAVGDFEETSMSGARRGAGGGSPPSKGTVRPAGGATAGRGQRIASVTATTGAAGKALPKTTPAMRKLAKLNNALSDLLTVVVELGGRKGKRFAKTTGAEAVEQLFAGRISDFPRLAEHWPIERAEKYVAEIKKLIIDRTKRLKIAREVEEAFAANKVNGELLNKLPEALRRDIKATVLKRWDQTREAFWKNVYDDRELVGELKKIGMTFETRGRAPVLEIGGQKLRITLDHVARKVENPLEAFSAENLRALTPRDNSVVKEGLVRDIKQLTGLNLDEFNALGPRAARLPKDLAGALGKALDKLPDLDDLFRGLGWEGL